MTQPVALPRARQLNRRRRAGSPRDKFIRPADRLKVAIDGLAASLYGISARDPHLRYLNLKTYRSELLRGFIISLHLALEDLLKAILFDFLVRQNKLLSNKETKRIVDDMRSAELIQWCGRFRLVSPRQYQHLIDLNRVRNASAHHWVLDIPKYRRIKRQGAKHRIRVPIVAYNGKNLLNPRVFTDEFLPVYGKIYVRLLGRVWRVQGKL